MADLFPEEYARIQWRRQLSGEQLMRLGAATDWKESLMGPVNAGFCDAPTSWPSAALGVVCAHCALPRVTAYGQLWMDHVKVRPEGACACEERGDG